MLVVYFLNSTKVIPPSFPYSMSTTDVPFLEEDLQKESCLPIYTSLEIFLLESTWILNVECDPKSL